MIIESISGGQQGPLAITDSLKFITNPVCYTTSLVTAASISFILDPLPLLHSLCHAWGIDSHYYTTQQHNT
jgi:hypothetical protein